MSNKNKKKVKNEKDLLDNFNTNNVLKFRQGLNNNIYYLPVYARLIVQSISQLSYEQMAANLNVELLISIGYEGIDDEIKRQLLKKGIRLSFDKDQNILLKTQNKDVNLEDDSQNRLLNFFVSKFAGTHLQALIRLSPFQRINALMSITFNKVKLQPSDYHKQNIQIHFNLMDHQNQKMKISSSLNANFGLFQVIKSKLSASFTQTHLHKSTPKRVQQQKDQQRQKLKKAKVKKQYKAKASGKQRPLAFNQAIFSIPLFKMPVVGILTIFLPLLLLSIINLAIFFQQRNLHDRIVSIAAIIVSIVALIPVVRSQIPPTPTITVVQVLVFLQALTTIFALLQSLQIQYIDPQDFNFIWYRNAYFMLALIVTSLVNLSVALLTILHFAKWVPQYRGDGQQQVQGNIYDRINTSKWKNKQCDKNFKKFFKMNILQVVTDAQYRNNSLIRTIYNARNNLRSSSSHDLNANMFLRKMSSMAIQQQDFDEQDDSNYNLNFTKAFSVNVDDDNK